MSESIPATGSTWRWRIWSAVVRLPLWAYIVVAILLLLAAAVWGLLRPIIREQQAVKRLQQEFGATVISASLSLDSVYPGPVGSSLSEPLWDRVIAKLTGGGTWIPEPISVVLTEDTPTEALRELPALRSIQSLMLDGSQWTDRDLAEITTRCRFRHLAIHNSSITPSGWRAIERLPLTSLFLGDQTVGPEFFRSVRSIPDLELLALPGCMFSSSDLKLLAGHPALNELSLRETRANSDWIDALASIPDLAILDLNETEIDDHFLSDLGRLKSLVILTIDGTKVTDAGLAVIPATVRLESLSLANADISESGLMTLKHVPSYLYLPGTRVKVTEPLLRWFLAHKFETLSLDESMLDPMSTAADELKNHIPELDLRSPETLKIETGK